MGGSPEPLVIGYIDLPSVTDPMQDDLKQQITHSFMLRFLLYLNIASFVSVPQSLAANCSLRVLQCNIYGQRKKQYSQHLKLLFML